MTTLDDKTRQTAPARPSGGLFRAFWRWHFYAAALVIPIMLMLAITGLIYLFRWQIDAATNPGLLTVDVPASGSAISVQQQQDAVTRAFPGSAITAVQEGGDDRSTAFTISDGDGEDAPTRNVYVNPFTGAVLGSLDPDRTVSGIAVQIHGMLVFGSLSEIELFHDPIVDEIFTIGSFGDRVIELAACWAVVMALTGYYLYARGRAARARRLGSRAKAAAMRHRHATIGAACGVGVLLLVITGLPWTGLWGGAVQRWASGHGLSLWGEDPGAESNLAAVLDRAGSTAAPAPWAAGQAQVPSSDPSATHDHGAGGGAAPATERVSIDTVLQRARQDGVPGPYYVTYPDGDTGVFSVLGDQWHDPANPAFSDVSKERVLHVDQYSGQVAGRYAYADYSAAAKVVSQGIALHEGRRLGSFNLVATTAFCLGVIFLCVSGPLMWWKRRPQGSGVGAPRGRLPVRRLPVLLAAIALGLFLPLFGLSLLLVLGFDRLVVRRVPALSRALAAD